MLIAYSLRHLRIFSTLSSLLVKSIMTILLSFQTTVQGKQPTSYTLKLSHLLALNETYYFRTAGAIKTAFFKQ